MNTSLVTPVSKDVSRVRFRWIFSELQSVPELKYQSELEVMELTFYDAAGNIVRINDSKFVRRAA